jgi:ComF family protein
MVLYLSMANPIMRLASTVIKGIIGLVYPPRCQVCGQGLDLFHKKVLCETCYNRIKVNTPPFCKKCGKSGYYKNNLCEGCQVKTYYFDASYSACSYEGVMRECIHNFKYNAGVTLERLFKNLMIEFAEKNVDMRRFDLLISVPLHRVKHRERTFNQSQILASYLSKRFKISLSKNNLVRTRLCKPQITLPRDKRLEEVKDSFKIRKSYLLKNKSILLVDDVFTTGATVNECSKTLKEAGAGPVEVLTLARSV